jgi:hypothetical protein
LTINDVKIAREQGPLTFWREHEIVGQDYISIRNNRMQFIGMLREIAFKDVRRARLDAPHLAPLLEDMMQSVCDTRSFLQLFNPRAVAS